TGHRGRCHADSTISCWPIAALSGYHGNMHGIDSTLDRLLDPVGRCLSENAARKLAGLRADEQAQAHVRSLAEKCNEGTLSPDDHRGIGHEPVTSGSVAGEADRRRPLAAAMTPIRPDERRRRKEGDSKDTSSPKPAGSPTAGIVSSKSSFARWTILIATGDQT